MTVKCLFMCDSSPVLVIKVCMNESVLKSSIFEQTYKIKFYCEIITKLMKFLVGFFAYTYTLQNSFGVFLQTSCIQ